MGHNVIILEATSQLGEVCSGVATLIQVGAGIQVPPNSTKVLKYLGIYERFLDDVVWPREINLLRWKVCIVKSNANY